MTLLHSVEDAAKALGVGRTVVYQLMAENRLRSVKIGKRRLVPDTALVAFVADLTGEHQADDPRPAA